MQQTTNDTTLWFESELTARYQADLSGAHARAYLHELREREAIPQTSLDQQIDSLLEQWRYSLLDAALAKQSAIPLLDLLKALVVIEAYDEVLRFIELSSESILHKKLDILFQLGLFCLDLDREFKAEIFFEIILQTNQPDRQHDLAGYLFRFAEQLYQRSFRPQAERFLEAGLRIWPADWHFGIRYAYLFPIFAESKGWELVEILVAKRASDLLSLLSFALKALSQGLSAQAEQSFDQLEQLFFDEDDPEIHYLALIYAQIGLYSRIASLVERIDGPRRRAYAVEGIFHILLENSQWQLAKQMALMLEPSNTRNYYLACLADMLYDLQEISEAEQVLAYLGDDKRDKVLERSAIEAAKADDWKQTQILIDQIEYERYYSSALCSCVELLIQTGRLEQAAGFVEQATITGERVLLQAKIVAAAHKRDHNSDIEQVLEGLEDQLAQIENDSEAILVCYELALVYIAIAQPSKALQVMARLEHYPNNYHTSERQIGFLEHLVDQAEWQIAEQYACSIDNLAVRNVLLSRLCLLTAQQRDRAETWRLVKLSLQNFWKELHHKKQSELLYSLLQGFMQANVLDQAKQLIPLIPSDDRRDALSQIIPAFIQKQNWNETLELLEANQNHSQTPQFYAQLYLAIRRSGHHKLADSLSQATPFRDKLDQYNESQSRYKEHYQKVSLVKQALAQGKWKKAEQLLTQNFEPEYRAWFYKDLSLALLPKKRWNELIRITQFVENDMTMFWWYREEAYQRLIHGLVKAGRWRQALGVINTLEPGDSYGPRAQPDREELIFELISALVEQSLFKQALSIYNEISQPKCKLKSCLSIANGLAKANKWQRVEQLLKDINEDMVCEYGSIPTEILNELLLVCYRNQRNNILDGLCEWADRLIDTGIHQEYFTTLCLIGRFEQAEKLSKQYGYHSEQEAALSYMVEGLLKRKIFDKAEQVVFGMTHENLISRSYELIARYYLSYHERDRLVRFAQGAIRQADNYDKIQACQPLIMSLIALRLNKAQRMVDLLKQQIALEQRLEDRMFATEGILIAN